MFCTYTSFEEKIKYYSENLYITSITPDAQLILQTDHIIVYIPVKLEHNFKMDFFIYIRSCPKSYNRSWKTFSKTNIQSCLETTHTLSCQDLKVSVESLVFLSQEAAQILCRGGVQFN